MKEGQNISLKICILLAMSGILVLKSLELLKLDISILTTLLGNGNKNAILASLYLPYVVDIFIFICLAILMVRLSSNKNTRTISISKKRLLLLAIIFISLFTLKFVLTVLLNSQPLEPLDPYSDVYGYSLQYLMTVEKLVATIAKWVNGLLFLIAFFMGAFRKPILALADKE
ncbi:MAG: hypothetical protein AAFX87_19175 [Bacteroidota bacterium]